MFDLLGPRHFRDVDETFNTRLKLNERTVIGEAHDLTFYELTNWIRFSCVAPRIFLGLLHTQADALGLWIVLEDLNSHLIANRKDFAGVIDATPRHVRNMEQTIDTTQVDECAVLGKVLDGAL